MRFARIEQWKTWTMQKGTTRLEFLWQSSMVYEFIIHQHSNNGMLYLDKISERMDLLVFRRTTTLSLWSPFTCLNCKFSMCFYLLFNLNWTFTCASQLLFYFIWLSIVGHVRVHICTIDSRKKIENVKLWILLVEKNWNSSLIT